MSDETDWNMTTVISMDSLVHSWSVQPYGIPVINDLWPFYYIIYFG